MPVPGPPVLYVAGTVWPAWVREVSQHYVVGDDRPGHARCDDTRVRRWEARVADRARVGNHAGVELLPTGVSADARVDCRSACVSVG